MFRCSVGFNFVAVFTAHPGAFPVCGGDREGVQVVVSAPSMATRLERRSPAMSWQATHHHDETTVLAGRSYADNWRSAAMAARCRRAWSSEKQTNRTVSIRSSVSRARATERMATRAA